MTRIIAGTAGGRRLSTPHGSGTRPTSGRVREALFSTIEAWCGSLDGVRFLDLYAGSGAVGLEAWSRGAVAVTLVERDRRAAALITGNALAIGFAGADVRVATVARTLARSPAAPYQVAFSDPPYDRPDDQVAADLAALVDNGWLAPGALVVVERGGRGGSPGWPAGIEPGAGRRYGETRLWYGHAAVPDADQPDRHRLRAVPSPEQGA